MTNNHDQGQLWPDQPDQTPDIAAQPIRAVPDAYKQKLKRNALRLAREHRKFCPAILAQQPCYISFGLLRALLKLAGIELSADEYNQLS
jgi:hypothetical protein